MGRIPYASAATSWLAEDTPSFLDLGGAGAGAKASLGMYDTAAAAEVYRNFLDWLFATFRTEEAAFRHALTGRLLAPEGGAVLVTGCGLGDDVEAILDQLGPAGEVYAQDLSPAMVLAARERLKAAGRLGQVSLSAGDACALPFADGAFDAAFHFGGINLFDDIEAGLHEMARVVRPGGRVVVCDEGVAPWLRGTDYAAMVIGNNRLWAHEAPIGLLPPSARDVRLSWVLGDCFWVIELEVGEGPHEIDPHVVHKGWRGGSMWTRHTGQLEAVTQQTREAVLKAAAGAGLSVHDWLERTLGRALQRPQ